MKSLSLFILACTASVSVSASIWGFGDASVTIQSKKGGSKDASKDELLENKALKNVKALGSQDVLKILLTTKEGGKPKRPHQTFLQLQDDASGLETSFPFQVKENGKAKVEIGQKDIPAQLLSSSDTLKASLIIASFGSSKPYKTLAFDLKIESDLTMPLPQQEKPLRYGKLPEIHHIFKADPSSPPKIITLVFTAAVVAALPALIIVWLSLGANLNHLSQAFSDSPIPHSLFFCSILAMEGVFFLYYTHWKLFQALPSALGIGLVTFLSGSRALREVQQRRMARSR